MFELSLERSSETFHQNTRKILQAVSYKYTATIDVYIYTLVIRDFCHIR